MLLNCANVSEKKLEILTGYNINKRYTYSKIIRQSVSLDDVIEACPDICPHKHDSLDSLFNSTSNDSIYMLNKKYCSKCNVFKKGICNETTVKTEGLENFLHKIYIKDNSFTKYQILIYILLHFLSPDKDGFIEEISFGMLSEYLDCSLATLKNSLETLAKKKLIQTSILTYSKYDEFNVQILDYRDMYSQSYATKGYLCLSQEFFNEIKNSGNVNTLRLSLGLMICQYKNYADIKSGELRLKKRDVTKVLPSYMHYRVKNLINSVSQSLCTLNINFKSVTCKFCDIANLKSINLVNSIDKKTSLKNLKEYVNNLNTYLGNNYNQNNKRKFPETFKDLKIPPNLEIRRIDVSDEQFRSLADMSLSFGFEYVKKSILNIVKDNISNLEDIQSVAALVRNNLKMRFRFNEIS